MGNLSWFEVVTTIIELVFVGVGGSIISILSYRRSVNEAIFQWKQFDGSKEIMDSRRFVQYELNDNYDPDDIRKNIDNAAEKIAPLINHYQLLGTLVKRRYVPISICANSSIGAGIILTFKKLQPYISRVRQKHNMFYADDFVALYARVNELQQL